MIKRNYTVVFENHNGVTQHGIVTARSERKAIKVCKEMHGDINILSISEKLDSSLPEDDNWA